MVLPGGGYAGRIRCPLALHVQPPISLRACYAMSSTHTLYAATRVLRRVRYSYIVCCYTLSGTDSLAYPATRVECNARYCPSVACYASLLYDARYCPSVLLLSAYALHPAIKYKKPHSWYKLH
eukprot:2471022-Rhodomonas_salina.5